MCGIVGYIGERDSADVLLDGLGKLEYRGYDSAGVAIFENGRVKVVKTHGRLSNLVKKLDETGRPAGCCGIGHTRWATHGAPSDVNAHPQQGGRVTLVHNGIIENYLELKQRLKKQGYSFVSDTDTEVAAKLIDSLYRGDPLKAIGAAAEKIRGSYAFGILFSDRPDTIYAVRRDSPLIVGCGNGEYFIASDVPAILGYTRNYFLLGGDEIAVLSAGGVKVFGPDGAPVEKRMQTATWDVAAAEKGGYPHFMLKEIHEQPRAVRDTVSPRIGADGLPKLDEGGRNRIDYSAVERVHIVACGTAMHAGMAGRCAIERLSRTPAEVDVASEFRYRDPILGPHDLVVIISQSGETADTLAALRLAKEEGCPTLAVVNVVGSSIAREADNVLMTWAGPEIAVASTKAYSVQLAVMDLLAVQMGLSKGRLPEARARELCRTIRSLPDAVEKALGTAALCQHDALFFQNARSLFFIGRGLDFAVAKEGSLKLKEISYVHSEAYEAGELKHGPISLIVDGTPVVAVATQRQLIEKTLSNVREVKARGADVLLIGRKGIAAAAGSAADHIIELPDLPDLFMPSAAAVPCQLFAYYMAVARGCDVDKPRNLAKSVTVE